jgi:hypothetical protein
MKGIIKDAEAFNQTTDGYQFIATYLKEPNGEALIEIKKDGELVKEFLFPGYKIWNIAAHAQDIVAGLKQESDAGIYIAGSTGFGGNVYRGEE